MIEANVLSCVTNWLNDAAEFNRADGCAGKKRREKEMVARTDDGNVVVIFEMLDEVERAKAGAEDNKLRAWWSHRCWSIGVME